MVSRLGLEPRALALKGKRHSSLTPTLPNKSHSFAHHRTLVLVLFGIFRNQFTDKTRTLYRSRWCIHVDEEPISNRHVFLIVGLPFAG